MNLIRAVKTLGLAAMLAMGTIATVTAAAPGAPSTQRFTANFAPDTDIRVVADAVAAATGRTFIIDPRVRAQVSLINPRPMTAEEFYQTFLSMLQVYSFAAVPAGNNVIKIVPDANVRTVPDMGLTATANSTSDEMVTQVITAKNINATQLSTVLRPLVAQYGNVAPVPGTNSLIITDRASNVARIMRIVSRVDQAGDSNIEVIPLQNSTAADLVRTLNALTAGLPAADAGALAPRVVADERSNSVLVSGDSAQRLRIATLIAHIDTPMENGGDTDVIFLKYADAEKLEAKLKGQLTGAVAAAAPGAAAAVADRSTIIWAEADTNALVITAPPKTMRSLKTIIDRLDIPRAQVQVEAIIVDVSTDKSADLGINWAVFSNKDGTSTPAGGFISPVGSANNNPVSIVDLAKGVLSPASASTIPLGATVAIGRLRDNGLNFAAMIRALRADANTNVIATPNATMSDNEEAELRVTQEVPFLTGQYTNTGATSGGAVNPFTTVSRQDVGTILKVTPQINGGDAMMLKISLESSELAGTAGDAGSLITNKRSVKTNVLIEDGGIIVIGGLIRDVKTEGVSRVPFLSRIPLIGEAFKVKSGKRTKSNLMVFIRPKIMTDSRQATMETNAKYNLIRRAQQEQARGDRTELLPILPFDKPPLLDPPQTVPQPAPPPAPASTDKAAAPPPAGTAKKP